MALLAAPSLAQTPSPKQTLVPGTVAAPRQPLTPKGAASVVAPSPVPATPSAKPGAGSIEGSGFVAPPVRSAPAGLVPKVVEEPLILWQPEGSTSPRPAQAHSRSATPAGRPPGGAVGSAAGPRRPQGVVDPFTPIGSGAGINPLLPGMAPPGSGGYQMDQRRNNGQSSPARVQQGARPQQRFRQGPSGMPMAPGADFYGGPPQGPMSERLMSPTGPVPPGMLPPGAVSPGMMAPGGIPPGAMPPGARGPGPGEIPSGAPPPGVVPPGVQAPDPPAPGSPEARDKSDQEWSPWPSVLATLGLGGGVVLLALLTRRRSASGSLTRLAIGEEGLKNAPQGRIQTGDKKH